MLQNATDTQTNGEIHGFNDKAKKTNEAAEHSEGPIAKAIEEKTAKLPSDLFLWAAGGAVGVSLILQLSGNSDKSRFIGQWVAPFLLLGVYNKIVKVAGSDRMSQPNY